MTQLASGLGLSLQGAEYVVSLEDEVAAPPRPHRARSRPGSSRPPASGQRRVDEVHRSYRRDLVLWQQPGTAVTPPRALTPPERTRTRITMDFNRLTVKAQEAVQAAAERARSAGNPELTAIHLLLALVAESDSVADTLLASAGVDVAALRRAAEEDLAKLPRATGASSSLPQPSLGFRTVLDRAEVEAKALTDEYVATEHLLIALTEERGRARELLSAQGATKDNAARGAARRPRRPARHRPERRGPLRRALQVRGRPDRARRGRQDRPRDRPRRRDPPHRPGAVAAARRTTRC